YTIFFKLTQVKLSILLSLGIISNLFVNIGNFLESQHSIGNDLLFFFNLTTDVVETFSNQFFNQILFKTFAAGREIFLPEINGISDDRFTNGYTGLKLIIDIDFRVFIENPPDLKF